jgi:hypothetical protein
MSLLPQYNVFYSFMPDEPDDCLVLFGAGTSVVDAHLIGFNERVFQARVRASSYDVAEQMAREVESALHGVANTQIGDQFVRYVLLDSGPIALGYDENGRYEFTLNFRYR